MNIKIMSVLMLLLMACVFFMSIAIINFAISMEFNDHADRCYDLSDKQSLNLVSIEDGKLEFIELANEQYQLMQVDGLDCWKYPLWKTELLKIEAPYTTYNEAVKGQLGV